LKCTNQEIERKGSNFGSITRIHDQRILDMLELKALIGLLYYDGLTKKNNVSFCKWLSIHSLPLFRATITINRLQFLFPCLSFDDKTTRDKRIKSDSFTHIRELWNLFITNCIQYYESGYNVIIDEQILNYNGRQSSHSMPLSYKRGKRGLKIVTMHDSETFYMISAMPYISKVKTESLESLPSYYVRKISEPIHNSCRNITCGSWFTSVPLVDTMREKFSLTMVGSLRRDNADVPPMFGDALAKEECQVAYHNNKTLVSYKPENDKIILLLSSLHSDGKVNKVENKPEIVLHHNKTIEASDTFDQLCHEYTVSRATRK